MNSKDSKSDALRTVMKGVFKPMGPNGGKGIPTKNYDDYQKNAEPVNIRGEQ